MARYATTEDLWECWYCSLECAVGQMNPDHSKTTGLTRHRCPRCNNNVLYEDDGYLYPAIIPI